MIPAAMPVRCPKRPILAGRKYVCALPPGHEPPCIPDPAPQGKRGPVPSAVPTAAIPVRVPAEAMARYHAAPEHVRERARAAAAAAFLRALD